MYYIYIAEPSRGRTKPKRASWIKTEIRLNILLNIQSKLRSCIPVAGWRYHEKDVTTEM